MAPLQVAPSMSPTTHTWMQGPRCWQPEGGRGVEPACHVGVWKGRPCAVGAGSLSSRSYSPAASHSQYLQEALRANICQVISMNLQLRTSSHPPTFWKCLFSQCTEQVTHGFPGQTFSTGVLAREELAPPSLPCHGPVPPGARQAWAGGSVST